MNKSEKTLGLQTLKKNKVLFTAVFLLVAVKICIVNFNLNINVIKLNIKPKLFTTARAFQFL